MTASGFPPKQGLYDPWYEHDACGVGFVADMKARRSHDVIKQGLQILLNLEHRGACGCEDNTGDGAGILVQMPDRFLREECDRLRIRLPKAGDYGAGCVFLPSIAADRARCEQMFEQIVREEGQQFLGWRDVPTDDSAIGATAKACEPIIRQVFIGRG